MPAVSADCILSVDKLIPVVKMTVNAKVTTSLVPSWRPFNCCSVFFFQKCYFTEAIEHARHQGLQMRMHSQPRRLHTHGRSTRATRVRTGTTLQLGKHLPAKAAAPAPVRGAERPSATRAPCSAPRGPGPLAG